MGEDDRKQVYWALLRGLAKTAQDRMCAADQQHDWGQWVRTPHYPDLPEIVMGPEQSDKAMNMKIVISAHRVCLNCGKEQRP